LSLFATETVANQEIKHMHCSHTISVKRQANSGICIRQMTVLWQVNAII
jgi:hypothetical protein